MRKPAAVQCLLALIVLLRAGTGDVQFHDARRSAGIRFVHQKGSRGVPTILEEAGPGVCVADFDGDGLPDIYLVNGRGTTGDTRNALCRNNSDGTFRDVAADRFLVVREGGEITALPAPPVPEPSRRAVVP